LRIAFNKPSGQVNVQNETILNVFPTADDRHRLVIAIQQDSDSGNGGSAPRRSGQTSRLVLRQETHAEDVGWFVQSCVTIEPEQLPGLKMALSSTSTRKLHPPARQVPRVPALLRFDNRTAANHVG